MYDDKILVGACVLALSFAANATAGTSPEVKCQMAKVRAQAVYAACRLKADAKAIKKGEAADYTKCLEVLEKKFAKAESKAGPGVCPTEADVAGVQQDADGYTRSMAARVSPVGAGCPAGYQTRSGSQVVIDLWQSIGAQDWALVACNYYEDAYVVDDQGILVGYNDIITAYQSLVSLFNGVTPTLNVIDEFRDTIRLLYTLDAGWVHIEDGVQTFEIEAGRIRAQTSHGLITFTGPPPG